MQLFNRVHQVQSLFNGRNLFQYLFFGDNSLLVDTIELFGPRYTPNAFILHLNDRANVISIHEQELLHQLGIYVPFEYFFSDIILYQEKKQAIFFLEVSTSGSTLFS